MVSMLSFVGPFIDSIAGVPEEFRHVVWTHGMRRLAVLVGRALKFNESVLLVGDTGYDVFIQNINKKQFFFIQTALLKVGQKYFFIPL